MLKTTKDENEKLNNELQLTNKRLVKAKTVIKQLVSNQVNDK